jgi:hypothetical protein
VKPTTPRYLGRSGAPTNTFLPNCVDTSSGLVLEDGLSHVGLSLLGFLVESTGIFFASVYTMYVWRDVRLGSDHRVSWSAGGGTLYSGGSGWC